MIAATLDARDFAGQASATAGIQEAIDTLPETGGTVLIPAGTYLLRRCAKLRPRVTLRGDGAATVLTRLPVVRSVQLTRRTIKNQPRVALQRVTGLRVGDELILRDKKMGGWNARHGVIKEIRGHVVTLDLVEGSPETIFSPKYGATASNLFPALWLPWAHEAVIENLMIDGGLSGRSKHTGDFSTAAIHTRRSNDIRISNVITRNWPGDGISVQKGFGAVVSNCLAEHCQGIGLHPGTGLENSLWVNNISRHNGHGLLFCQGVVHAVVQGNLIYGNAGYGIFGLGDPDRFNSVLGNICAGNGKHGIEARKALGNTIQGNILRNNSQEGAGEFAGLYLELHRDNLVTGNLFIDDQEHPTQTKSLMSLNPAGRNLISGNSDQESR